MAGVAVKLSDQWDCHAHFHADADIAGPGVVTSFVLTAWITCFVACIQLYCVISARFRHVLLRTTAGTTAEHVGKYTVQITELSPPRSLQTGFPILFKLFNMCLYAFRCWLAMFLSFFKDDQPRLQLFSQLALDRLCDLQLVTGTAIIIAGIVLIDTMSFYHQSLITSYWLLTLNAFWAARAGYLDSNNYGNDKSFYFWTRWVAILTSNILSIYYQIVTTLEAANHWDTEGSGKCYRSHELSPTDSQYFWIAGITFESLYMLFYTVRQIAQSYLSRHGWLQQPLDFVERRATDIDNARRVVTILGEKWKLQAMHAWAPIRYMVAVLVAIARSFWYVIWQCLALWAWGDSASIGIVVGYIALAAWNTFDVIDTKLSNKSLLIGEETHWGFGQILPLGLLALICLDLLDIVNASYRHRDAENARRLRHEDENNARRLWSQNEGLEVSIDDKGEDLNSKMSGSV